MTGNYVSNGGQLILLFNNPGSFDVFRIAGTADLTEGGTLTVNLVGAFNPPVNQLFSIITMTDRDGVFTNWNLPQNADVVCNLTSFDLFRFQ